MFFWKIIFKTSISKIIDADQPGPPFVIQITENMLTFFYAVIFPCRIPSPSLRIIFKRPISFQNNWKLLNLLSFFISHVLLGNTVFAKTFLWSEFWKICLYGQFFRNIRKRTTAETSWLKYYGKVTWHFRSGNMTETW